MSTPQFPCVLQVSSQSQRLPRKALLPLGMRALWTWPVQRALRAEAVSVVYLDIPRGQEDDDFTAEVEVAIRAYGWQDRVRIIRPQRKLPTPDLQALHGYIRDEPAYLFRITGDCPFLQPSHFNVLADMTQYVYGVKCTRSDCLETWREQPPPGTDIELLPIAAVHDTGALSRIYSQYAVERPLLPHVPPLSFVVDTLQDYVWAQHIAEHVHDPQLETILPWYLHQLKP